ncbi:hypothetical protein R3P38DRAFT_127210 [Favolaschia claudopus]|uniref:Uncharacterized protein n=1 Tax=Favolaschia claudopus TaxID=2862362 RepID=A0AAV9ZWK5_9AGAR
MFCFFTRLSAIEASVVSSTTFLFLLPVVLPAVTALLVPQKAHSFLNTPSDTVQQVLPTKSRAFVGPDVKGSHSTPLAHSVYSLSIARSSLNTTASDGISDRPRTFEDFFSPPVTWLIGITLFLDEPIAKTLAPEDTQEW